MAKKVTKYMSNGGGLFDTRAEADRADARDAVERLLGKSFARAEAEAIMYFFDAIEKGDYGDVHLRSYLYRLANLAGPRS